MIQRGLDNIIVPVGETTVLADDTIIMIEVEHALEFPRMEEKA